MNLWRRRTPRTSDADHVLSTPLVSTSCAWTRSPLRCIRARSGMAAPCLQARRVRTTGKAGCDRGEGGEGFLVRLSDVRSMRAVLDRHVLLDELPQTVAQRSVWWRA